MKEAISPYYLQTFEVALFWKKKKKNDAQIAMCGNNSENKNRYKSMKIKDNGSKSFKREG